MAFVRTHATCDGEVIAFWDNETKEAKIVRLSIGEPIAPHFPSSDSLVIFAGGAGDNSVAAANRQIAKWKAAHGLHLRLVQ